MPDRYKSMAKEGDPDIDVHPQCPHQATDGSHDTEDGDIPRIVEHARAIGCQAVCVQAKIPADGHTTSSY